MPNKSFYLFVQTVKNPYDLSGPSQLAAAIHDDTNFPKTSENYHLISSYLEDHTNYVNTMDDFDLLWSQYIEKN